MGDRGKGERGAYDDGDVEHHLGDVARVVDPEGDDQLAEGGAEGVCKAGQGGGGHTPAVGEPEIRVAGWGGQHKRLGKPRQDLAEHDDAKQPLLLGVRAGIADPVADQQQGGGGDDGRLRAHVQDVDDGRGGEGEGEEEGGAQPVDGGLGRVEVGGRMAGDGREGEPLGRVMVVSEVLLVVSE